MGKRSPIEHREAVGRLLRDLRERKLMTQLELAKKIDRTQSAVSKYESGELRLDVLELRDVLAALGVTLPQFVRKLEEWIVQIGPGRRPQRLPRD